MDLVLWSRIFRSIISWLLMISSRTGRPENKGMWSPERTFCNFTARLSRIGVIVSSFSNNLKRKGSARLRKEQKSALLAIFDDYCSYQCDIVVAIMDKLVRGVKGWNVFWERAQTNFLTRIQVLSRICFCRLPGEGGWWIAVKGLCWCWL